MLNSVRRLFQSNSQKATPYQRGGETPYAIYMTPDGRQLPISIKTDLQITDLSAWTGNRQALDGSEPEIPANEWGYARAATSSVWAHNCIDVRAQLVAAIMRKAGHVANKADGTALQNHRLMQAIARAWTAYRQDVFYEWEYNRCAYGENYTELVSEYVYSVGFASTLRVINPLQIEPVIQNGAITYFQLSQEGRGMVSLECDDISFDRIKNPEDDYRGLSLLKLALSAVNIDMHVQTTTRSHYRNNLRPGIIFSIKDRFLENGRTIKDSDWTRFIQNIRDQAKGTRNAYRPLALDLPVDVTVVDPPSMEEQGKISDTQKERIAAAFRVPVGLVTFSDQKYQLSPEQRRYLYQEVLIPECEHLAMVVNADILPFFDSSGNVEFKLDEKLISALTEDQAVKAASLGTQFQSAQITFNQMQDGLGLPKQIGGDFYLFPSGFVPVQQNDLMSLSAATLQPAPAVPPTAQASAPIAAQAVDTEQIHTHEPAAEIDITNHPAIIHAKHATAEDELAAWSKAYKNSGRNKAARFTTYLIREEVQAGIKAALDTGDESAIKAAFETARETLAVKAIQATRLEFEASFGDVLSEALAGNLTRTRFGTITRAMLRSYARKAYSDGLKDGGIDEPVLTSDDEQALSDYLATQSVYVTDLGKALFKDETVTNEQADAKPVMWWNKSVYPAYSLGLLQADENGLYVWNTGRTEKHCNSCLAMNGQKHRLKDYHKRKILPKSDVLDCTGMFCDCGITRTTGRESGNWI